MRVSLAYLVALTAVACAASKSNGTTASVDVRAYETMMAEMFSEPPEAQILDEQNDTVVLRAFPRYAMIEGQATVVYAGEYMGPERPKRYLRLKVGDRTCSEYWESGANSTYPDLSFETQYIFVLQGESIGECNVLEVRHGNDVVYTQSLTSERFPR